MIADLGTLRLTCIAAIEDVVAQARLNPTPIMTRVLAQYDVAHTALDAAVVKPSVSMGPECIYCRAWDAAHCPFGSSDISRPPEAVAACHQTEPRS